MAVRDLIIIGAGPSGLSAAIAAKVRGLDYQVLEQGVLVDSIFRFPPQMVFFTTPELLAIGGPPLVSPYDKPPPLAPRAASPKAAACLSYRRTTSPRVTKRFATTGESSTLTTCRSRWGRKSWR